MPRINYTTSEETKKKIGLANKGKKRSEETKKRISEIQKKRYKLNPVNEATRRKIGLIHKGKILSKETREKISKAHIGMKMPPRSEEFRAKMRLNNLREKSYNWKGGRKKSNGYIRILRPTHPFCDKRGYVLEHRLVMEAYLGCYLKPKEVVHHKSIKYPMDSILNKSHNVIENLILFKNRCYHQWFHKRGYCNSKGIIFNNSSLL